MACIFSYSRLPLSTYLSGKAERYGLQESVFERSAIAETICAQTSIIFQGRVYILQTDLGNEKNYGLLESMGYVGYVLGGSRL